MRPIKLGRPIALLLVGGGLAAACAAEESNSRVLGGGSDSGSSDVSAGGAGSGGVSSGGVSNGGVTSGGANAGGVSSGGLSAGGTASVDGGNVGDSASAGGTLGGADSGLTGSVSGPGVYCDSEICGEGDSCCWVQSGGPAECFDPDAYSCDSTGQHLEFPCDGPEDCGNGEVCCFETENADSVSCRAPNNCGNAREWEVCHSGEGCAVGGRQCMPLQRVGGNYEPDEAPPGLSLCTDDVLPESIECGSQTCAAPNLCCWDQDGESGSCSLNCSNGDITFPCDGSDDCAAGDVCCFENNFGDSTACQLAANCESNDEWALCDPNDGEPCSLPNRECVSEDRVAGQFVAASVPSGTYLCTEQSFAPPEEPAGGVVPGTEGVVCGASACEAGPYRCCFEPTGLSLSCFNSDAVSCSTLTLLCDGPEDCTNGEVCCFDESDNDQRCESANSCDGDDEWEVCSPVDGVDCADRMNSCQGVDVAADFPTASLPAGVFVCSPWQ